MDNGLHQSFNIFNKESHQSAIQWREKWLGGIQTGKNYNIEAREKAAIWAVNWGRESLRYILNGESVAPGCTEVVLEALQRHGGCQILPLTIDRLEDITIGLGGGFSGQGEVCGAISGHIIAIGIDIAARTRETAVIRRDVMNATVKFCRQIKAMFGALRCRELTGINFLNSEGTFDLEALDKVTSGDRPPFMKCEDIVRFCIYTPLPSEEV